MKAFSFTHRTKVFADGTVRKNNVVTPGELAGSAGGSAGSKPISGSEVVSGALSVVGQPNSVRWAARYSGGLKSLWRSDEGRYIRKRG